MEMILYFWSLVGVLCIVVVLANQLSHLRADIARLRVFDKENEYAIHQLKKYVISREAPQS